MLRPARPLTRGVVLTLLGGYAVALAFIVFWPTPVDEGAGPILDRVESLFPWATYRRVEFTANIALFAPLGFLLTLLLRRWAWCAVIGVAASGAIEVIQAVALPGRTATPWDVLANGLGTITGVAIGLIWLSSTQRTRGERSVSRAGRSFPRRP
ncbi:VanZ family protein [Microbacterium sp. RD1]|uniref:VanZ family protein n=1 Tax=Microbacterium sp. RD1 TaxID=3457313 RepID=UPI003FA61105